MRGASASISVLILTLTCFLLSLLHCLVGAELSNLVLCLAAQLMMEKVEAKEQARVERREVKKEVMMMTLARAMAKE